MQLTASCIVPSAGKERPPQDDKGSSVSSVVKSLAALRRNARCVYFPLARAVFTFFNKSCDIPCQGL